ncbi:DUF896 domain-containing protein [Companilactobacillus mishanensis]|uniref:UPF0291 protein FHL02_00495 n=1 Tax=Companilactobacillus mishanensis TaxID=2486008 RepID=A0A5P0ZEL1_9LACO|nr:DUF896 domain-containing protein [Companilactobacillus mishanensis]MQS44405.1 DUF896 domain-containing protein [Companilactobacillus mishanensis]MQS51491.1 DUF896 domain-containing protein [Companilactobacillus mishanensis]MQS88648.1 DUF896 domain-containing protein [Companilactobacillus mishanensis]
MSENESLVQKLNALAKKAKEGTITKEEEEEQRALRKKYLQNFREGFKSQIETMRVFDKSGKEVTPEKVRKIQREKGLRDD